MGEVLKRMKGGRFIGWYLRYYDADGRRRVVASKQQSHADARRMLQQIEARIARDEAGIAPEPERLTVAALCERFLASAHPRVKDAGAYRRAASYSLRPLLPLLGQVQIHKLRRKDIEAARDRLSCRLKPNSVRAVLRPLAAALTWAVRQELIPQTPMSRLHLPRREQSSEHLSAEDATRFLQSVEQGARRGGVKEWCQWVAVSLGLRLGLRRGEIFGLRWSDVDLAHQRLTVARSFEGLPKSGKPRTLPIPAALAAVLKEWRALCPAASTHVCCIHKRVQASINRMLEAAGCPAFRRGWHALRHTFASCFVASGGSVLALKEMLGHSALDMTLIYSHVAPAALVADVEKMRL